MEKTLSIILNLVLVIISLAVIMMASEYEEKIKDEGAKNRLVIYSRCYIIAIINGILLDYASHGSIFQTITFQIQWFSFMVLLAVIVSTLAYVLELYDKLISYIVAFFCYFALGTMILELYLNNFKIIGNPTGVFFASGFAIYDLKWIYNIPIGLFIAVCIYLILRFGATHGKKSDKKLFMLSVASMIPAFIGLLTEIILEGKGIYYPVFKVVLIVNYCLLRYAIIYMGENRISIEDLSPYLNNENRVPVYITDADLKVIYMNEAADIIGEMYRDDVKGRRLDSFMYIDNEVYNGLSKGISYSEDIIVPATYISSDKKVQIEIKRIRDAAGELVYNIVTCNTPIRSSV
ncbi:MAG: hypothetical protein K6B28_10515 [Lachnospiraceae bacterium]|nr:hypothetical protein [Lachnospiraceae bacterium]